MIAAMTISVRAGRKLLLDEVSVSALPGEVLALVGPNGAGKSTLLRTLAGEIRPHAGRARCEGRDIQMWPPLQLARRRAVVGQHAALAFPMTAAEVVALGRMPWHGAPESARDAAAVQDALDLVGIAPIAGQPYATLSGGERQRVHFARALAQLDGAPRPAALLLDEPTASLDVRHGAALLSLLRRLARQGIAVMVVLHDLNEARFVADKVAVLANGRLHAIGASSQILHPSLLERIYGVAFREVGDAILPAFAE